MIAVTDKAASAIRQSTNTEIYPKAGLRIKSVGEGKFAVGIVPQPADDDVAIQLQGANLYLDHAASRALNRATLDADPTVAGIERFQLMDVNR